MHRIQSFFWYCAGVNQDILKKCPSDASKYVGIGASILFTGLFAALAAGYALYTVFDNYVWPILFALLWGAMIFNLDRFIVSSMRKNGDTQKEWLTALPRIALAILISIVVARPLELKIFEKEIDSEIALMQQEDKNQKIQEVKNRFVGDRERLNNEISTLKSEISSKTQRRDELRKIAQEEADGTGGSMQRNAGPIYQIKKADADRVENELNALRETNLDLISQKELALNQLAAEEQSAVTAVTEGQLTGLASRIDALDRLTQKSEAIWVAHVFILLLFIFLETAPIFVKLISSRGPYDYVLKKEEYDFESAYYEDLAKVNALIKKRAQRLSQEEKDYLINRLDLGLEQT
jgi:uncharacterized protein YpmS